MATITFKRSCKSAPGNSKSRYKARRKAQRESGRQVEALARKIAVAATGCSINVLRATEGASDYAKQLDRSIRHHEQIIQHREQRERNKHMKVCNEAGRQIHAVQKRKGSSIPLI
ncbi:hypothetical protein BTJ39_23810 [Izhakiella australiensis]|uniref:Uncharacterized protein n=1 Tax=Izhakiella australiensis TaxID=1926881 RepID=A0A1S8Y6W2_9GAMM|nr:hypothetical protein [Izhakiella australiensis]OON34645.1 hypothetical protein BTJ39_23810 [Izhakiella australiensis]